MAIDTFYSDVKSLNQNIGGQVYSHKSGFAVFYPLMNSTGDAIDNSLSDFVHKYGAPEKLTFDGAQSKVGRNTKFQALCLQLQARRAEGASIMPAAAGTQKFLSDGTQGPCLPLQPACMRLQACRCV